MQAVPYFPYCTAGKVLGAAPNPPPFFSFLFFSFSFFSSLWHSVAYVVVSLVFLASCTIRLRFGDRGIWEGEGEEEELIIRGVIKGKEEKKRRAGEREMDLKYIKQFSLASANTDYRYVYGRTMIIRKAKIVTASSLTLILILVRLADLGNFNKAECMEEERRMFPVLSLLANCCTVSTVRYHDYLRVSGCEALGLGML
ncbi:hypothetical protein L873DRAFT_1419344 [Choiromyces venosus 120613-1]|uniref:Uncharacterized protein n=1 Tax=Choiromyces venosus 120613-1 TaxID=1336337 RepID=A0A3N4J8E0_9PEZI|nr:hypothetical protein L873DRAFT_1419344 [Choiromyces venosus 120613-1]